ncbi:GGDEF domain-containing protein [Thiohalophilus thiocyanatoxydans]|uniref:Diguanylate cyclase (GGDEF)-like protein n=1 Tax=Thiohalophilus thiocyanatoxydans TaxID=381308 RepID=A0A4R8IT12_9GAMM|nr:GGDEF domain-containing protein [Thiohalophilus thiocyanatoxydans]TDY04116.1 diguanylate cyclase (GGDEF)-like protein [Thiohalophilus thiocyanatoxydans]
MPLYVSIKTNLVLTIFLVGLLGLGLALASTSIYQDVILDYKRQSLVDLVEIKIRDKMNELEEYAQDLGNNLKISTRFRQALGNNDTTALHDALAQQFHQYFVTANILRLERLLVFSPDFEPLAESSAENTSLKHPGAVCPGLVEQAEQRRGAERLKILATLCNNNERPYHAVLLPLGGLNPSGYLEIVTAPTRSLSPIEDELGMPVQFRLPDGELLYRSPQWPESRDGGLVARYRLDTTDHQESALLIEVYDDTRNMYQQLQQTRNTIMLLSAIIIALVTAVALILLRRTLIRPLQVLNSHLQRLHGDNKLLGEPITSRSNIIEVNQLIDDFNLMAGELHNLYGRLERMAYTDPLTHLPNRGLFNNYIDYLLNEYSDSEKRFALFLIDLDEFKRVNDEFGHEAGDMLLCEIASRMNNILRTPTLTDNKGISLVDIANHDLLVRLGGDEFAVVLPDIKSNEQVDEIAKKLTTAARAPITIHKIPVVTRLSIGIAIYPDDSNGRTGLLRRADVAMYHAKNHKLDYCFYHHEMT